MTKKLFKGTFNYAGVNYLLRTQSFTESGAWNNFINQLHKRTKIGKVTLKYAFSGVKDNYLIQEVRK